MVITKYHSTIIVLYTFIIFLLSLTTPEVFQFGLGNVVAWKVVGLVFISVLAFSVYVHVFEKRSVREILQNLSFKTFLLVPYVLIIGVSEEIIFRGLIQSYFAIYFSDAIAVVFSSIVFGLAHLPNGAKGTSPKKWNWKFASLAFFGGLIFGSAYALTGTLLLPTALHVSFLFLLC